MDDKLLRELFDEYKLDKKQQEELIEYIYDIYIHPEFQKRLTDKFMHHDQVSLGRHILEDTIITYKLVKKKKRKNYNLSVALYIAMFHDLYTKPWQNAPTNNVFTHKHGFRHPVEAVINALNWFPDYFDKDAYKIIDGIIHHMYPFPVCTFYDDDTNILELENYNLIENIDDKYLGMIKKSSCRFKIFGVSFSRAKTKEGRLMSKVDKKVSINNFRHTKVGSKLALLTGKNKHIRRNK